MRRVLIDYAAARRAEKRGGGAAHVPLDETVAAPERHVDDLLAIDEALNRLEQLDPRQVTVVECHVFARGKHGFALRERELPIGQWPRMCGEWLGSIE